MVPRYLDAVPCTFVWGGIFVCIPPRKEYKDERTGENLRPFVRGGQALQKMGGCRLFPRRARPGQKALYHRDAAARTSRGSCTWATPWTRPGRISSSATSACRAMPRCGCRAPTMPSIATEAKIVADDARKRASRSRTWAARSFWSAPGTGKSSTAGRIVEQLKKLGSSCDWERERFTMDEGCTKAVLKVFHQAVRQGPDLPGRAHHQLVPPLQDLHFRRRGGVRGAGRLLLASAIPAWRTAEDIRGAGHHPPGDHAGRYRRGRAPGRRALHAPASAKRSSCRWWTRKSPSSADDVCGQGIRHRRGEDHPRARPQRLRGGRAPQPARHQRADRRRAHRRGLRQICRAWTAMEARKADCGRPGGRRLPGHDRGPHSHNVGTCYRCGTTVEPMVSQAVVREDGAAGEARPSRPCATGVSGSCPSGSTRPITTGWRTSRDWCISRQLWWGHRIPA